MNAEDFVPGLYPLKVGAIAVINLALADMPVFGALRPQHSIETSEYENTASNRAGVESDIEAAIVDAPPPPQVEIDPSPLTDDEIAHGQRIANDPAWDAPGIPLETVLAKNAIDHDMIVIVPQIEAELSVMSNGVGDVTVVGESARPQKLKSSNRNVKRNPKAVQQVIDYLMRNPDDMALTVAQLTDKLKYDVRMKVGHSSVGKALGVMKADGKEKAS
jgi:hypothetical protein